MRFDIKNQPGERDINTLAIYVQMSRIGSIEATLKFFNILHKIIRGQDLSTGPQTFGMTRNLVIGESLQVFEKNAQERETETHVNYESVMKDLISHFFSPTLIQHQKRYLRRGLYKSRDTKIQYFI